MKQDVKEQTIEEAIDKAWDDLFDLICKNDDYLYELKIVYQEGATGKTIIKSWRDSQQRLQQNELESRKMDLARRELAK